MYYSLRIISFPSGVEYRVGLCPSQENVKKLCTVDGLNTEGLTSRCGALHPLSQAFGGQSGSHGSHFLKNQGMSGNSVLTGMSGIVREFCCLSGNLCGQMPFARLFIYLNYNKCILSLALLIATSQQKTHLNIAVVSTEYV